MRRLFVAMLAFLWLTAPALAHAQHIYETLGAGVLSCGSWTEGRSHDDRPLVDVMEAWVEGFVTAENVNRVSTGRSEVTKAVDSPGLNAWIDNYCTAHPLESLSAATIKLTVELIDRANAQPSPPAR
jgi:hypothetical protein